MLALIWLVYACFGITVGSLPPLVDPILVDLGMTSSQMGLVLGAWQLVYIGTATPLGTLVDRIGTRRSIGAALVILLLSLGLRGLAGNFATLFLAVALFGLGGPIISIGAPKVVSQWFEGRERGLATGIYTTGAVGGITLSLATAASVVLPWTGTWRGISVVYGAIVLVVLVAWVALARNAPVTAQTDEPDLPPGRSALLALLRNPNVRVILFMAFAVFLINHALGSWLPTLLQEQGMTLIQGGAWTAVATGVSIVGILMVPAYARRGRRVRMLVALFLVTAITTAAMVALDGPGLVGATVASMTVRMTLPPMLVLLLMDTPGVSARRMGAAAGLYFASGEVGGFGGPFLLGALRDATGGLAAGVYVLAGVAVVLVLAVLLVKEGNVSTHEPVEEPRLGPA